MSNGDRIKYPKNHGYKICNILEKKIKEKLKNIIKSYMDKSDS